MGDNFQPHAGHIQMFDDFGDEVARLVFGSAGEQVFASMWVESGVEPAHQLDTPQELTRAFVTLDSEDTNARMTAQTRFSQQRLAQGLRVAALGPRIPSVIRDLLGDERKTPVRYSWVKAAGAVAVHCAMFDCEPETLMDSEYSPSGHERRSFLGLNDGIARARMSQELDSSRRDVVLPAAAQWLQAELSLP